VKPAQIDILRNLLSVVDWSIQVIVLPERANPCRLGKISLTQEQNWAFEDLIANEETYTKNC